MVVGGGGAEDEEEGGGGGGWLEELEELEELLELLLEEEIEESSGTGITGLGNRPSGVGNRLGMGLRAGRLSSLSSAWVRK